MYSDTERKAFADFAASQMGLAATLDNCSFGETTDYLAQAVDLVYAEDVNGEYTNLIKPLQRIAIMSSVFRIAELEQMVEVVFDEFPELNLSEAGA